jgi:ketosteroid isomerase-like protein
MTDYLERAKVFYSEVLVHPQEACDTFLASDFVLENYLPDCIPFGGRYEGSAGMLKYLGELTSAISMGPLDLQEWVSDGTAVVLRGEESSAVHETGRRYQMRFVHWLTFNSEGRIARMVEFNDTARMEPAFK